MAIAVTDKVGSASYFFYNQSSLSLAGYPPFKIVNINPAITSDATVNPETFLIVDAYQLDIIAAEKSRLNGLISDRNNLGSYLSATKSIQSVLTTLKSQISSINLEGLKALLGVLESQAQGLKANTKDQTVLDSLDDVIGEITTLRTLNPVLGQGDAEFSERITKVANMLEQTADAIISRCQVSRTTLKNEVTFVIGFASAATKQLYIDSLGND